MDGFFTPEAGLAAAQDTLSGADGRVALVLPSTRAIGGRVLSRQGSWSVIGRPGGAGVQGAVDALRHLWTTREPRPVIIHTDQLYQPADATVLALLEDRSIFISPVECILNDRYGYRLLVWTASGLRMLPPGSPMKDIGSLVVRHLRDCSLLGAAWLEREHQVQRTIAHRREAGRRQLRFLRSSLADAYREEPGNPMIDALARRIGEIGRALEKDDWA